MKKFVALSLAVAMILSLASCTNKDEPVNGNLSSSPSSQVSDPVSEYPSSKEEISSVPSSDISSILSEIESSNISSKENSSKQPVKQPVASSKPPVKQPVVSSKPPESSKPESKPEPLPEPAPATQGEMKAVWLSFLEFQQFAGSSEAAFTATIQSYFDNMVNLGLNTVMAQVRPHGDSFYPSAYYPWSKCISGTMGQSVDYDPLAIMVREAHARSMQIHAWINPYRTMTAKEFATVDDGYLIKQWYNSSNRGDYMVSVGKEGRWWLKPGNSEAQNLIINGAKELAQNYDIDGIHLDDYFYGDALSVYGDSTTQAKANTTALVKGLHDGIKSVNSAVDFGISPAGGFRENNALPSSDLGYLSTDLKLWCQNPGYIDYIMPQVYWGYDHPQQPYTMTLDKWQSFVTEDSVKLYIGLAPSNPDLPAPIIESQIRDIQASYRATGYCLFRYQFIHNLNLK